MSEPVLPERFADLAPYLDWAVAVRSPRASPTAAITGFHYRTTGSDSQRGH